MKKRWTIAIGAAAGVLLAWFAAGPVWYEIEFRAMGHSGTESIRLTRNHRWQSVLSERTIGREWTMIRAVCFGSTRDLQVHLTGLNSAPNLVTIDSGVVRVTTRNLLGYAIDQQDWLNINSQYLAWGTHQPLFPADSPMMASTRAGYSGANGYYQLVPP